MCNDSGNFKYALMVHARVLKNGEDGGFGCTGECK